MSMIMGFQESAEVNQAVVKRRKLDAVPCKWNGIDVRYNHSMPVSEVSYADLFSDRFKIVTILGRVGENAARGSNWTSPCPWQASVRGSSSGFLPTSTTGVGASM